MKMELITVSGFVIETVIFIAALSNIYTKWEVRFKELEIRIQKVEQQDEEIYKKLDIISEKLTDLKVELQNKINRQ